MTQNEMIELADKAGFFVKDNEAYSPSNQEDYELTPCLDRFAKLVAEKERTWAGLTDEEIADCAEKMEASDPTDSFWREFFRGIEAKLKEKNT